MTMKVSFGYRPPKLALFATAVVTSIFFSAYANAQDKPPLKVGVLNDQSSAYADLTGPGSVIAAQMAIDDFGGKVAGRKIELLSADHQNKTDVGVSIASKWFDSDGVAVIFDLPTSSVALAVQAMAKSRPDKMVIMSAGFSSDLTGKACTANSMQAIFNTYAAARSVSLALVQEGFKKWYYIQVDNLGGVSMYEDSSAAVKDGGGTVVGSVKFPIGATDLSSQILQAQASQADVLGLAMGGNDTVTAMKAAKEFGLLDKGLRMATYSFDVTDINGVGLDVAQGTYISTTFYWDQNDQTRAFAKRFFEKHKKMPTQYQATIYVALTHYLRAVDAAGGDDKASVVAPKMRELKVKEFGTETGWVREDGQFMRDVQLGRVRKAGTSRYPWDYIEIIRTIPAEKAFRPLSESACPLVKK